MTHVGFHHGFAQHVDSIQVDGYHHHQLLILGAVKFDSLVNQRAGTRQVPETRATAAAAPLKLAVPGLCNAVAERPYGLDSEEVGPSGAARAGRVLCLGVLSAESNLATWHIDV